jgi:alpha-1,2-mannosyltransferase
MRLVHRYRFAVPLAGTVALGGMALLVWSSAIRLAFGGSGFVDMHVFWRAAGELAHGRSPYDPAGMHAQRLVAERDLDVPAANQSWAIYPPIVLLLLVPVGLLPWHVGAALVLPFLVAAPGVALWIMGVRDWRCYLGAYLGPPVVAAIQWGTISGFLMLGTAVVWRGRGTLVATAATVVAKLWVWPLGIGLAALEGIGKGIRTALLGIAATLAAWSVIGFADLTRFPQMLADISASEAHDTLSPAGLAFALGLRPALGQYLGLAAALAVCALAWRAGRRRDRDRCLTLVILASLLASPILWMHYLVLVYLPLAARRPRFHWLWLVPLVLSFAHPRAADGHLDAFIVAWPCVAILLADALGAHLRLPLRTRRPATA